MTPGPIIRAITILLAGMGAFFCLVGTLGLLRFPDFYSRTHAATKCDALGGGAILAALALYRGLDPDSAKILALAVLIFLSGPTAGHALARAAYRTGLEPWRPPTGTGGDRP